MSAMRSSRKKLGRAGSTASAKTPSRIDFSSFLSSPASSVASHGDQETRASRRHGKAQMDTETENSLQLTIESRVLPALQRLQERTKRCLFALDAQATKGPDEDEDGLEAALEAARAEIVSLRARLESVEGISGSGRKRARPEGSSLDTADARSAARARADAAEHRRARLEAESAARALESEVDHLRSRISELERSCNEAREGQSDAEAKAQSWEERCAAAEYRLSRAEESEQNARVRCEELSELLSRAEKSIARENKIKYSGGVEEKEEEEEDGDDVDTFRGLRAEVDRLKEEVAIRDHRLKLLGGGDGEKQGETRVESLERQCRELRRAAAMAQAAEESAKEQLREVTNDAANVRLAEERIRAAESRAEEAEKEAVAASAASARVRALEEEKRRWTGMLREALLEAGVEMEGGDDEIAERVEAARSVVKAIRKAQTDAERARQLADNEASRVARLQGENEVNIEAIREAHEAQRRAERERDEALAQINRLERQLRVAQSQGDPAEENRALRQALEEAEKAALQAGKEPTSEETQRLRDALHTAERRIRRMDGAIGRLERDNAALQASVGRAGLDRRHTKVLHFRNNPTRQARRAVVQELRTLRAQQKQQQQQQVSSTPTPSSAAAAPPSSQEVQPPISSLPSADTERRLERLRQVFKERIRTFREAVYLLTGFKIDMTQDGAGVRLTLRSMFAEAPDDALLFRLENGRLDMLETSYAAAIDTRISAYLHTAQSVPAFLSSLTLELFERQTFTLAPP